MPKKRVYVESSMISYLTARPASVAEKRVMQEQTRIWWERRDRWELFISPSVVAEIRDGDREAARKRLAAVHGIPLLPEPADVKKLAAHLIAAGGIPEKAIDDAVHIAIATLNCMDYLVTWNQAHIFNPDTIGKLYSAIRESGYVPSVLVRPDSLLEV